ncbi:MAG TPA: Mur ligase family protein, partial [Candidatus Krumholzibacterium sp.]|nr:Mur ligase family protein [Candidatus Krumholzibacterium sp.]
LITNIDAEHLDFYGNLETIRDAFVRFARQVPFNGTVICCIDDPNVRSIMPRIDRRIITYGFSSDADVTGEIEELSSEGATFSVRAADGATGSMFLRLPGRHNVSNALGVCALAGELGIDLGHVREGLAGFEGVGRRFELKGEASGVRVMDDYGHHPTEVKAAIETAAKSFARRLVVVFQPHRYTRTRDLHQRFSGCFDGADELFITDIYAASETPIPGVSGELIYRSALRGGMKNVTYIPDWDDLEKAVFDSLREGDLLLTLGAGNIYRLGEDYLEKEMKN